jgi:drug/metabolite transporter (DMT)-like permease
MRNFFFGLALGLLGAILWIVASIVAAAASFAENKNDPFADPVSGTLMVVGFAVMFLGPALFWIVVPVAGWWRRRRRAKTPL